MSKAKTWQLSMKECSLDQKLPEEQVLKKDKGGQSQSLVKTVSCGERMYAEFKVKAKVIPVQKTSVKANDKLQYLEELQNKDQNLCIEIPLKGGPKNIGPLGQSGGALTEEFLRAIQEEYVTRYLEIMKIEPTQKNKQILLQRKPLTSCEVTPSWNSSGWLADFIKIYPNRQKKITFENQRDIFLQARQEKERELNEENIKTFKNNYTGEDGGDDLLDQMRQNQERNLELKRKREKLIKSTEDALKEERRGHQEKEKNRAYELNLDQSYWQTKFLYPFALDPAPLRLDLSSKQKPEEVIAEKKRQKFMSDEGLMETQKYQFPKSQIQKLEEFLPEISKPITMTLEDIQADMNNYAKNFPIKSIPHITEADEINDQIHNYRRPKPTQQPQNKEAPVHQKSFLDLEVKKSNTALTQGVPTLKEKTICEVQGEIQQPSTSKLIGLIAHLAYWNVFGHLNHLPLDMYHMKQMFISISTIRTQLDIKYQGKKFYHVFLMPMLVLAIRIEVELIFKNSYPHFFSIELHEKVSMKLINDLITQLIDPNIFYSRFSFFESGRDAISIKYQKAKSGQTQSSQNRFFRRSALVEQLFPNPSEGKVRALFGTGVQAVMAKTAAIMQNSMEFYKTQSNADAASKVRASLHTADQALRPKKLNLRGLSSNCLGVSSKLTGRQQHHQDLLQDENEQVVGKQVEHVEQKEEDRVLKLVNKVQMFQIAVQKINKKCTSQKEEPLFTMAKGGANSAKNNNFSKYFDE